MTTEPQAAPSKRAPRNPVARRIPLFIAIAIGIFVWNDSFGLFPIEREILWKLPVSYGDVRTVELQVWQGETLLIREQRKLSHGLSSEVISNTPLKAGHYRGLATVQLVKDEQRSFATEFEVKSTKAVTVDFAH